MKKPIVASCIAFSLFNIACNEDEESYKGERYTLASHRITRSVEGATSQPPISVIKYYGGTKTIEPCIEGIRLTIQIQWQNNSWDNSKVTASLISTKNVRGFDTYTDNKGIERIAYNTLYEGLDGLNTATIHNDKIVFNGLTFKYRKRISTINNDGEVVFSYSEEKSCSVDEKIDISGYRQPKENHE